MTINSVLMIVASFVAVALAEIFDTIPLGAQLDWSDVITMFSSMEIVMFIAKQHNTQALMKIIVAIEFLIPPIVRSSSIFLPQMSFLNFRSFSSENKIL